MWLRVERRSHFRPGWQTSPHDLHGQTDLPEAAFGSPPQMRFGVQPLGCRLTPFSHGHAKGSRRNNFTFCCWPPGPLARRERRAIPGAVCEERATKPAGLRAAARRGAAARARIGFVAAPRRCPTSPSSRRLASARPALAPKWEFISARALSTPVRNYGIEAGFSEGRRPGTPVVSHLRRSILTDAQSRPHGRDLQFNSRCRELLKVGEFNSC